MTVSANKKIANTKDLSFSLSQASASNTTGLGDTCPFPDGGMDGEVNINGEYFCAGLFRLEQLERLFGGCLWVHVWL